MFLTIDEAKKKIAEGKLLHIAGDESLLRQLPQGNWLGGTTPYFIVNDGGTKQKENVFVSEFKYVLDYRIVNYDTENITKITDDAFAEGLTFLVMPFASEVATVYAKSAPGMEDLLMKPIVGWVTGVDLDSTDVAKVYNGQTGEVFTDKGVALHIKLPPEHMPNIGTVNIFAADNNSPDLTFHETEWEISECVVDGKEVNFADYLIENKIDVKLPLVADYNGTFINAGIKEINTEKKTVSFYAPVLAGETYRFAGDVGDYEAAFRSHIKGMEDKRPVFSCNCVLNFLYGGLDHKATPPFEGPATFGEIAYQLLSQTLVYVEY